MLEFISQFFTATGVLGLGWVIAAGLAYAIYQLKKEYDARYDILKKDSDTRVDALNESHAKTIQVLHDDVKQIQEARITETKENRDDFIDLTTKVLSALERLGAK